MRGLLAFAALLAVAAAAHYGGHGTEQEIIPELFEGQREYVYNYRSLVATGLPRQSQRFAGLEKYGVLTVQVHEQQAGTKLLGLRLRHVMSGSFDKEVHDIENRRIEGVAHANEETIEKYGPVFVKIQDNEVQKLKAPENMPEEIINIYRAIAAIFTVGKPETLEGDKHPFMSQEKNYNGEQQQPIVYRRQEQGITGNFETIYQVLSNTEQQYQHQQLNVTKTRNYMKNIGRDGRYVQNGHDGRGCQNVCRTHKPEQLDNNMQPELSDWMKPTAEGCPVNFHPKTDLVEAFTTYNYNMTVEREGKFALIHEVQALDKKILPLRKQQIKTVSLVKLVLVEERPITENWNQQTATKQYDEITYRFPEGHQHDLPYLSLYNQAEQGELIKGQILPMIKVLSEIIVSDNIELKSQTGDKIVQLTMALGKLNKHELMALWTVLGETTTTDKAATDFDKVQRKVLIDTIALSGSNNATELLLDLITGEKLTTFETVDTLQTFQQNLAKPSLKVMHQLKGICTDAKFQEKRVVFGAACIAFSEVVRTNCGTHSHKNSQGQQQQWSTEQGLCGEQEYKQFVEYIRNQLHASKDFTKQTIYIQTLGRLAHPEAIKALIPYVHGEQEVVAQLSQMKLSTGEHESEYVQFVRQLAIYALHEAAKEHGSAIQPIVQTIYFNKQEDYELRIAALSVLIATQPTEAAFGRIVTELGQEQDLEVASYTYSALKHLANTTVPCMEQTARRVQNVLGALPEHGYGTHHSKWVAYTQYNQLTNLGLKGQWQVTQSNVSAIPRAFYGSITGNKGPFVSTIADFGMVTKGFENLYQFINQKGGMNKIVENVMQRIRRDTREHIQGDQSVEQILQQIEQAMQFNTEENNEQPRAIVHGSFLGNEAYLPIDKEYITKVGQKFAQGIVQLLRQDGTTEKTYRFVRILMPRTYVHVAPGVNGLPVILSNRHPIVVSLALKDLQTRFGAEKGQMKLNPFTLALSGRFVPTIYHTSIHTAMTINPVEGARYAYGVRAVEQTYVTLPVDATVQYTHHTKTFAFTIRPAFEKVFFHKTRAMTFKTEALLIRPAEMSLLERYTVIKTQQKPFIFDQTLGEKLGMAIRVQGMSENEEYATNFMSHKLAFEKNALTAFIAQLSNEWFTPRTWSVRVEENKQWPVQEMKMLIRLGGSLFQKRMQEQEQQGKHYNEQEKLSQEQLVKEQAYPEHMRMIAYEQEFEKLTGRKPETEQLEQALKRIVGNTEKYWSLVDRELTHKLDNENAQARTVEYLISAKGQKKPVHIHGHIILAATPSKQAKLGELKMDVLEMPYSFEVQAISAFTKIPQPFETEIREQEQRGIFAFTAQLETPKTGKQHYSGKVEMTKSEEQKRLTKEQKPWYYQQCEEDKKEYKSEMSTACEKVRYHKSALNKLRFEIELPQMIHESLRNVSHQIRDTLKVRLYRNLNANYVADKNQENKIEGELVYSEQYPEMRVANLTLRTPDHEELMFERIALPKALRPNTMWTLKQQIKAFLMLDRPEPVCVYNGQKLRTFDNVTISLKAMTDGEKYVIARDNNEKPRFTILGEKKNGGEKTHVEIILREVTLLKLTPPTQQNSATYKVGINSTTIDVTPKKTEVYQYGPENKHMLTIYVEEHKEGQDTLVIKVRDQRMRIVYDGKNFKVEIGKRMLKGQLTGLCGDMNNQHIDELTGPRGCNFEHEQDFVRSFALSKETTHGLEGKWMCPEGVYPRGASTKDIEEHKQRQQHAQQKMQQSYGQRKMMREQHDLMTEETKMIPLNGKLCFSTEPVNVCKHNSRQLESEMQSVQFICLNQNHPRTMQIQRQVQIEKVASNLPLSGQYGYVHHEMEVATRCGQ